jgi:hypothetical protein
MSMNFTVYSGADRIYRILWMFFLFSFSGRKGKRESAFGGRELWAGGPARHREPTLPQARRAGKSPFGSCSPFF